ncbi:MAG: hypothetical protein AAF108_05775 [Planctomycetota bacterium]
MPALTRSGSPAASAAWAQVGGAGGSPELPAARQPRMQPGTDVTDDVFNPTRQRLAIVDQLKALNAKIVQLDSTLRSGRVRVRVEGDVPEGD